MIFNLRNPLGKRGGTITEDSFEFSGNYAFARDEDTGNWELALWDSGSLTWLVNPGQVDLCIIGAGQDGGDGALTDYNYQYGVYTRVASGKGGDGGRIYTNVQGVTLDAALTVVVGESGADSSIGSYTSANGPAPKAGGTAASMPLESNSVGIVNTGGIAGVRPFGADTDETMIQALQGHRIGASGGAGMANNAYASYWTVDHRPVFDPVYTAAHGGINKGGATDGADGADSTSHLNGYDATGLGNGGGGGYGDGRALYGEGSHGVGGHGSKGAVLIRNHREA